MSQSLQQAELFESEALAPVHSVGAADPAKVRVKPHAMFEELRESS
jgi:phage gp46-like protein